MEIYFNYDEQKINKTIVDKFLQKFYITKKVAPTYKDEN